MEPPSPFCCSVPLTPSKRVFNGSSSSAIFLEDDDDELVEIPPPLRSANGRWKRANQVEVEHKKKKQKEVIPPPEIIDVDDLDDEPEDSTDKLPFKSFDTVEDFPDHPYLEDASSNKQPPKEWAKKIQGEWKILQDHLPDTIFVKVCESRMDILRAAIIGAEGTPYHDGLFFFDVFFPSNYPSVPPQGEIESREYNEETLISSLKTMVCHIRNPPKHFEELVAGHFSRRARAILLACKSYIGGAHVGGIVNGGVGQDLEEGDTTEIFRGDLTRYIKTLVEAFKTVNANGCDEFLSLAQTAAKTTPKKGGNYWFY
ncbi:OLC1v1006565C1 [Oldenlandia corymbosa var. corymbosa]|uniref:OLC1v1006565C1 n=1 Tax=Oldenlandia corymbosa var. corymbosa TaxID=529605 RepID=A0AAV1DK06_OLDCO|nr:OLC1v1006565C1 [Oldenlandia corymbosa var. corymbosa]